jgi:hypothetical protein
MGDALNQSVVVQIKIVWSPGQTFYVPIHFWQRNLVLNTAMAHSIMIFDRGY